MHNLIKLLPAFVFIFLVTSCSDNFFAVEDVICPLGFKTIPIKVVDQDYNPITGAEFTVVNTRTGKEFCVDKNGNRNDECDSLLGETETTNQGIYILISEYNTSRDEPTADVRHFDIIEAIITKNGVIAKSKYIVIFDNNCYPKRVEGPEVVVLDMSQ